MEVRAAVSEDAPVLGRLHTRAWQVGYKDGLMPDEYLNSLSAEERADMWTETLSRSPRPRSARLVSLDPEGQPRGFVVVGPAGGESDSPEGEVYALNVDPDVWGHGHGRALLSAATSHLREEGFEEAILWVHTGNQRARGFYEAAGWSGDGVERLADVRGVKVPETRYRLRML